MDQVSANNSFILFILQNALLQTPSTEVSVKLEIKDHLHQTRSQTLDVDVLRGKLFHIMKK
jgi:hypothetical protein